MKVCLGISFCYILFILLLLLAVFVTILILCSIITADVVTAIFTMLSFCVAVIAACYAIQEYKNHREALRTKLLCEYNQRYSTDSNIRTMLDWMQKVAITDNDGDIVEVNLDNCNYSPDINTQELFMRFFEEIYMQINERNLDAEKVYDLFSYYTLKYDQFNDYHKKVTDYTSRNEREELPKEKQKAVNKNWKLFASFVDIMYKINITRNKNNVL